MVACKVAEYVLYILYSTLHICGFICFFLCFVWNDRADESGRRRLAPKYRYELALIYLKQSDYNLDKAIEKYMEDERWEREHPLRSSGGGGTKGKSIGRGQGTARWRAGVT